MFSMCYVIELGLNGIFTVEGPKDRFTLDPQHSLFYLNRKQAELQCAKQNLQRVIDKGIADKQMLTRPVTYRSYYTYLVEKYSAHS